MNVYVTTMYRYADRNEHSYVLGVYTTQELAEKMAVVEEVYRGGKYSGEVIQMKLDEEDINETGYVVKMLELKDAE